MANPKNTAALAELKERFANADTTLLTEYRGLSVAETTTLRRALGADVTYSVAKNTMIKLAAKEAGVEFDESLLTDPTAIAFVHGEAVDAAKAMKDFGKDHKNFVIKGGFMDGNALSAAQVEALADMDNRETTLAAGWRHAGFLGKGCWSVQRSCISGRPLGWRPAGEEGLVSSPPLPKCAQWHNTTFKENRRPRKTITIALIGSRHTNERMPSWLSSPTMSSSRLSRK